MALVGAAITAGVGGIADLLFSMLARKGGRAATKSLIKQLFGKAVTNPESAQRFGKKALVGAAKLGGIFGGIDVVAEGLLGTPEEQHQLASQNLNPTVGPESQELIQLEQLLAAIIAQDERDHGGGIADEGLFL